MCVWGMLLTVTCSLPCSTIQLQLGFSFTLSDGIEAYVIPRLTTNAYCQPYIGQSHDLFATFWN